ncbi:AMIN domain-containing protein, partial [uncultured Campylobacter sp.]|uniref:AMIN domain-containing protein n=1 Tax=uncultured Campylobacter sp. TaxID=218934 RepID=UPI00262056CF
MAKIIKIFLIAAFSCVLAFGASSEAFFAKFDKDFIVATPNYKRSLHKELKSLYQGTSDKEVRIKALKRLVYSSKNLGLDSSPYESALAKLQGKASDSSTHSKKLKDENAKNSKSSDEKNASNLAHSPKASASKNSKNSKNSTSKNLKKTRAPEEADLSSLSKEDLEFLRSTRPIGANEAVDAQEDDGGEDAIAQNEDEEAADQSNELRKSSVKKADKNAQLALNSLRGDADEIVLEFNRDLKRSDYKDFTIASSDNFRFVIDFSARQKSQKTRLKDSFVSDVRVSQYNDKTVRIVLSDPKEFNANVEINGNMMILSTAEGLKAAKSVRAEKNKDQKSGRKRGREQDSELQISTIDESQGAKSVSVAAGKIYKSTKGKLIVIDPGHGGSDS